MSVGQVVRYTPDPSRHDPRWCREGYAISNEAGVFLDTYWGSGSEAHRLLDVELATIKHLFWLHDYDELDEHDRGTPGKWKTYAPNDRQRVTSQHGLQARYFIRKGATPDLATQIANAEEKVRNAEHEVDRANSRLAWARQDLAALLGQAATT